MAYSQRDPGWGRCDTHRSGIHMGQLLAGKPTTPKTIATGSSANVGG